MKHVGQILPGFIKTTAPECGPEALIARAVKNGLPDHEIGAMRTELLGEPCIYCGATPERRDGYFTPICGCYSKAESEFVRERTVRARLHAAGVGKKYLECSFRSWDSAYPDIEVNHGKAAVEHYVQHRLWQTDPGRGLCLLGTSGTGKTHLAVAVLRALADETGSLLFTEGEELKGKLFGPGGDQAAERMKSVQFLVLDDFDKIKLENEDVLHKMLEIVSGRDRKRLPTIFTLNLRTRDEISKKYGSATASRMFGMTVPVPMFSRKDYRRKAWDSLASGGPA